MVHDWSFNEANLKYRICLGKSSLIKAAFIAIPYESNVVKKKLFINIRRVLLLIISMLHSFALMTQFNYTLPRHKRRSFDTQVWSPIAAIIENKKIINE